MGLQNRNIVGGLKIRKEKQVLLCVCVCVCVCVCMHMCEWEHWGGGEKRGVEYKQSSGHEKHFVFTISQAIGGF